VLQAARFRLPLPGRIRADKSTYGGPCPREACRARGVAAARPHRAVLRVRAAGALVESVLANQRCRSDKRTYSRGAAPRAAPRRFSRSAQTPARARFSGARAVVSAVGLLALALVTAAGAGAFILARAWGETVRQEAYLPDLRAMARRSPNDGRLLALLGARQAQAADYEVAAETLERAVAGGARHASVWLTWSAATAVTGNNVKAGAILRLGMRDNPSAAGHLRMAIDRVATLGPRPSPVALAMAICPEDTRPILAEYGRGSFLNEIAQWQGRRRPESSGFATREKWAQTEPKNPKVQLLWAQALLRNDRLPEAEETVEQVLKMDPKSPDALLVRGDVFFRGELFAKAALSYKEALRHRPDWFPALLGLGKATVEKKLIRISIETLEKATRLNPESADAWIGLGRAYFNQRFRFDKALAAFEQAARLAPERTDFFPYYSDVLRVNYRADEAEALLRRRVADAPEDARTQYLLALMLIDYKPSPERLAEAERALRTSIAIQPNVPSAQIRLGQLLLNQGKADEAGSGSRSLSKASRTTAWPCGSCRARTGGWGGPRRRRRPRNGPSPCRATGSRWSSSRTPSIGTRPTRRSTGSSRRCTPKGAKRRRRGSRRRWPTCWRTTSGKRPGASACSAPPPAFPLVPPMIRLVTLAGGRIPRRRPPHRRADAAAGIPDPCRRRNLACPARAAPWRRRPCPVSQDRNPSAIAIRIGKRVIRSNVAEAMIMKSFPLRFRSFRSFRGIAAAAALGALAAAAGGTAMSGCRTQAAGSGGGGASAAAAQPVSAVVNGGKGVGLRFVDVADAAGLKYRWTVTGKRPLNILQTIGNGCAFLDYDNDGNLDILLVGSRPALFRGDGKGGFTDVTAETGMNALSGHFLGCAVGDYDGDGFDDVYISGYREGRLLRNQGGRRFEDVTRRVGLKPQPWGTSCAWGDFDGDGFLDLYVANYVDFGPNTKPQLCSFQTAAHGVVPSSCGPRFYTGIKGVLYRNVKGGARFEDVTRAWGAEKHTGKGLGVAVADFDGSGRVSIAVANDEVAGNLFRNAAPGKLDDIGVESGTAFDRDGTVHGGMGIDWGDYDNDGKLDLFVATFRNEAKSLYHNDGEGMFTDVSYPAGVAQVTLPWVAFGTKFFDADNDGWLDLVLANGHVQDNIEQIENTTYRQPVQLLRNRGGDAGTNGGQVVFEEASKTAGTGRGSPDRGPRPGDGRLRQRRARRRARG
jgi:tetratricopeptide (TPR) repeat protein